MNTIGVPVLALLQAQGMTVAEARNWQHSVQAALAGVEPARSNFERGWAVEHDTGRNYPVDARALAVYRQMKSRDGQ